MNINEIKKCLDKLCDGTNFSFNVERKNKNNILLFLNGDNPENEDWCYELEIEMPKCKEQLISTIYEKIKDIYEDFNIEEEVFLMLEAKRNGFQGVPGVVDLVHNEEYKEKALSDFVDKLRCEYVND